MQKKTAAQKSKKTPPKRDSTTAHPPGKSNEKTGSETVEEFLGVHVIGSQDIENHFGTSEIKTGDGSVRPATNRPKAEVHLHLDERIWQQAQAAAQQAGLELPEYVERALEQFIGNSAE